MTSDGIVAAEWAIVAFRSQCNDQSRTDGSSRVEASTEWNLNRLCQLWSSGGKSKIDRHRSSEAGEAVAEVPDEGMPTNKNARGRRLLEATYKVDRTIYSKSPM